MCSSAALMLARHFVLSLLLAPAAAGSLPSFAHARPLDAVVAVVEGTPVTVLQVRHRAAPALLRIERSSPAPQRPDLIKQVLGTALEQVIEDRLFEAAAHEAGVQISESAIDSAIVDAARQNAKTRADFLSLAFGDGFREADLREYYRHWLLAWHVLTSDWNKYHDGPMPRDAGYDAWREEWLRIQKNRTCIERRVAP